MDNKQFTHILNELDSLKKLLILNTLKVGADQAQVARVLGITDRQIRNILAGKT
jgi:predicted transcriptional regulator